MSSEVGTNSHRWIQIIPGRLYLVSCDVSMSNDQQTHCFTTDEDEDYHYEKFYDDFGPLNLAVLHRYCVKLKHKLDSKHFSKKRIVHYTLTSNQEYRSNAAYLIGSFAILFLGQTADQVWHLFHETDRLAPFLPFRDASPGESIYGLRLPDIFRAVQRAHGLRWIDFDDFDVEEYEYFERVENGDLNWIIPNKILAFCGPHLKTSVEDGYPRHSPEAYFEYFREQNVTNVVRLNRKIYESHRFTQAGFFHTDLFFVDGSTPSNSIVLRFIKLVEEAPGAVAVHCKAGLGRTGTLIACYMMKHYGFTAPECIAWIRICRPGSIIGPQQPFLMHVQNWCRSLPGSKNLSRRSSPESRLPSLNVGDDVHDHESRFFTPITVEQPCPVVVKTIKIKEPKLGDFKQGDRLMKIKGKRSITTRPRSSTRPTPNDEVIIAAKHGRRKSRSAEKTSKPNNDTKATKLKSHPTERVELKVVGMMTRRSRSPRETTSPSPIAGSGGKRRGRRTPPNRHATSTRSGSRSRAATSGTKRCGDASPKANKVIVVIKSEKSIADQVATTPLQIPQPKHQQRRDKRSKRRQDEYAVALSDAVAEGEANNDENNRGSRAKSKRRRSPSPPQPMMDAQEQNMADLSIEIT